MTGSSDDNLGREKKPTSFIWKKRQFFPSIFPPKKISRARKIIGLIVMLMLMPIAFAFAQGYLRTFKIASGSMEPTILIGDCLIVDARKPVTPKRGDIIAVKNPDCSIEWLCKRVVALPNDKIEFIRGSIFVNEKRLKFKRSRWSSLMRIQRGYHVQQLGPDEYYVLGDNINNSHDSRYFGPVHSEDLIGLSKVIYWPPSRARSLRQHESLEKTNESIEPGNDSP